MRTLVIETATAACSVALIDDLVVVDWRHEVVGRGHAERLVPMIAELENGGRADAILVDCGPGSFTGIRVGIAAAKGLAIGWGVPVRGYTSTAVIAAAHLIEGKREALAVVLEGGHGEVFMQGYCYPLAATDVLVSLTPAAAFTQLGKRIAVGSGLRFLEDIVGIDALPDARDARLLSADYANLDPRPIYGRAPVAKPAQNT